MADYPERGDIYIVDFSPTRGSEQAGRRPALVVSNDIANRYGGVITVAPITHTKPRKNYPQNVRLPEDLLDGEGGTILCGQVLTVAKERLGNFCESLPQDLMTEVGDALRAHLDL